MTRQFQNHSFPRRQRGIVLFVALIAMLLLSLAGIALMRSVDTSLGVAGNLGFRHASIAPVNPRDRRVDPGRLQERAARNHDRR
jgi:hypothetical protein